MTEVDWKVRSQCYVFFGTGVDASYGGVQVEGEYMHEHLSCNWGFVQTPQIPPLHLLSHVSTTFGGVRGYSSFWEDLVSRKSGGRRTSRSTPGDCVTKGCYVRLSLCTSCAYLQKVDLNAFVPGFTS